MRQKIFFYFLNEIEVITIIEKYLLLVVASIVHMVECVWFEFHEVLVCGEMFFSLSCDFGSVNHSGVLLPVGRRKKPSDGSLTPKSLLLATRPTVFTTVGRGRPDGY